MKISLITVTFNAEEFLKQCFSSVVVQNFPELEYIVVDGASTDNTLQITNEFSSLISKKISEKDKGIYDAMNKGIQLATGDIVGILNADDEFSYPEALKEIAALFETTGADILYANLNYSHRYNISKVLRKWISKPYKQGMFNHGWMPAHPTFYVKRQLFEQYGMYDLSMGSAADYELMLRFMHQKAIKAVFLDKVTVTMRTGGMSNSSIKNRLRASLMDLRAMRKNGVKSPLQAIMLKPLSKITQYFT